MAEPNAKRVADKVVLQHHLQADEEVRIQHSSRGRVKVLIVKSTRMDVDEQRVTSR